MDVNDQIKNFSDDGYLLVEQASWILHHLEILQNEINTLADQLGISRPFSDEIFNIPNEDLKTKFYRGLRYLPSLAQLGSCEELISMSKALGLKNPIVMNASNIRMDEGGANPHSFHWHQDYTYLLGSLNSLTYWIPMQKVNKTLGGIEIVAGSHKKGLEPFEPENESVMLKTSNVSPKEIRLVSPPHDNIQAISLERGGLVAFSQFLLHRSLDHEGPHVRWTIQIRHSDASEPDFLRHGCPMGDTSTIYQNPELLIELTRDHDH
jgi:hypothetical protein